MFIHMLAESENGVSVHNLSCASDSFTCMYPANTVGMNLGTLLASLRLGWEDGVRQAVKL